MWRPEALMGQPLEKGWEFSREESSDKRVCENNTGCVRKPAPRTSPHRPHF